MKKNQLFLKTVFLLFSLILLFSCRTETNIDENRHAQINALNKNLKLKDIPELKNILTSNPYLFSKQFKIVLDDNTEVFSVNSKEFNSYSIQINPKNDSAFYFVILSYNKTDNNKVSKLIGKFVPDHNNEAKNIKNFTGLSSFETITGTPIVSTVWKNGKIIGNKSESAKKACSSQSYIVANMCSERLHWPWEAGCTASGKAYFSISTSISCDQEVIDPNWGGGGGGFGDLGGGGGGFDVNPYELSPPLALDHYLQNKGGAPLSSEETAFLNNNFSIADSLKYYFLNDESDNSASFFHWTMGFFIQNSTKGISNISWEQFQNWFMGKSEGQDGEYDASFWENPNLTFAQQSLPSWADFYNAFPKHENGGYVTFMNNHEVYQLVGGHPLTAHLAKNPLYQNACALRGSRALNYSGINIGVLYQNGSQVTEKGNDGKNYILNARAFNAYMNKSFPTPTYKLQNKDNRALDYNQMVNFIKDKTGLYNIINKDATKAGYSGHVDMIIDGQCLSGCDLNPDGGILKIEIWKLK